MIKHFCDRCHKEITKQNEVEDRLSCRIGGGRAEVVVTTENGWNNADFCKYCILDALYDLDDRPKAK